MSVRVDKAGCVWTVIHSRPDVRNAMDPESADELVRAFESFDADPTAHAAVFWGEGGGPRASSFLSRSSPPSRGRPWPAEWSWRFGVKSA
jgi:1,4-dihydroxy-2-naphthoyl-CoA synthase